MPELADPKLRKVGALEIPDAPPLNVPAFAELCVATNFSFLRGASHPDELALQAARMGYRAIGITDRNSFAGIVRMHVAAKQLGIRLVVGVRLTFAAEHPDVLVWPRDRRAYGVLCRLLTTGKRRATKGNCELGIYEFLENSRDVHAAIVPPISLHESASPMLLKQIRTAREALGSRLSIAASCAYESDNDTRLDELLAISRATGVALLATNDVHYHVPQRRPLQDVLTAIRLNTTVREAGYELFQNGERYLKSASDMLALFAAAPHAIRRGLDIVADCSFNLDELRYEYPTELSPPGTTPLEYLESLAWSGAKERYPQGIPDKVGSLVRRELKLIGEMKIEAYFLTVYDIVRFARSRGILCQGRGSAANSAVCYCLGVTAVDPDRVDVLFERFVSSARNEPPDIDIDFEHERREEVIQYVYEKYGRDRAGMTAEIISYRGRSAVRDVGKAMGLGLDTVDHLAKRLDWWHRGSVDEAKIREAGLNPADRTLRLVMQLSDELLGFPRHLSQHVGGMVMTRGPLSELVPIENAAMPGRTVIEWDKQDLDDLGILKVDLLALGMLTCIAKCLKYINETRRDRERELQMHTIPPECPIVYDMISNADTVGVFQIESRAQMSMLPRLRPKEFYDLVIEVAIVRPGPIQGDMVHPYLRRRQGLEPVEFPKDELRAVLGKTLGVPLFQEQAMRIAIECAGFEPHEADKLRRAVTGFRRYGDIETFAVKFVEGMLARGYERDFAERCFKQLRGFASYGFPESHSASFALLVYVSSWIKRHKPAAFCTGLLNSQPMGFYAPAQIVRDAQMHGVRVLPVDVNFSDWDCALVEGPTNSLSPVIGGEESKSKLNRQGAESAERKEGVVFRFCNTGVSSVRAKQDAPLLRMDETSMPRLDASLFSVCSVPLWLNRNSAPYPGPLPRVRGRGEETFSSDVTPRWDWGKNEPRVRLGFRMIRGFSQRHAEQIEAARCREPTGKFRSLDHFIRATGLSSAILQRLARADAFGSLGLSRREATWEIMAHSDESFPLFDGIENPSDSAEQSEDRATLPVMRPMEEVTADYVTAGLSLKRHPVALIREDLASRGIIPASTLMQTDARRWVKVAGLVLIRQRPGTASGIVFETLEDETGVVNLIIRPKVYERYRHAARHATFVQADGYVERQGQVVHVMVMRMHDLSELLSDTRTRSRDFR